MQKALFYWGATQLLGRWLRTDSTTPLHATARGCSHQLTLCLPGKLRTEPLHTPAAAKLAGPPQPRPLHFLNSKATQAGWVTPYLHGDSGAAIPTATPASPAPGRETKTPGQYHWHPLRRRGGGGTEWGRSRSRHAPSQSPYRPHRPPPHCRDSTDFSPSSTMTPFLPENSQQAQGPARPGARL